MKNFYEMLKIIEQAPMVTVPQVPQQNLNNNPAQQQNLKIPQKKTGSDPVQEDKLKKLLGKNYENFVNELKQNVNDPKFLAFIKAGLEDGTVPQDDVVKFSSLTPACIQLTPTQNEIDIKGSLFYPLTKSDAQTITSYINGGTFAPGGPIVTCGNGKYIIDGHHRWSQLYCLNPNAKIQSIDMSSFSDPVLALKVTQLSIAATQNEIKVQTVKGTNLMDIGEDELKSYISNNISDNAKQAFTQLANGQDPVVYAQQLIWNNVLQMQKTNRPISGASKRDFMPQTDSQGKFSSALQQGQVNWKTRDNMNNIPMNKIINKMPQNMPTVQNASVEHDQPSLNEWLVLSGIKK